MMKDLFVRQLYFSLKLRIEGSERHQTFGFNIVLETLLPIISV
jgi:hypothetical protein